MWTISKKQEKNQKIQRNKNLQYIYQIELDKAFFQNKMAYLGFKELTRRTVSDTLSRYKAFSIAKNLKYNGYQCGLVLMVIVSSTKLLTAIMKIKLFQKKN